MSSGACTESRSDLDSSTRALVGTYVEPQFHCPPVRRSIRRHRIGSSDPAPATTLQNILATGNPATIYLEPGLVIPISSPGILPFQMYSNQSIIGDPSNPAVIDNLVQPLVPGEPVFTIQNANQVRIENVTIRNGFYWGWSSPGSSNGIHIDQSSEVHLTGIEVLRGMIHGISVTDSKCIIMEQTTVAAYQDVPNECASGPASEEGIGIFVKNSNLVQLIDTSLNGGFYSTAAVLAKNVHDFWIRNTHIHGTAVDRHTLGTLVFDDPGVYGPGQCPYPSVALGILHDNSLSAINTASVVVEDVLINDYLGSYGVQIMGLDPIGLEVENVNTVAVAGMLTAGLPIFDACDYGGPYDSYLSGTFDFGPSYFGQHHSFIQDFSVTPAGPLVALPLPMCGVTWIW